MVWWPLHAGFQMFQHLQQAISKKRRQISPATTCYNRGVRHHILHPHHLHPQVLVHKGSASLGSVSNTSQVTQRYCENTQTPSRTARIKTRTTKKRREWSNQTKEQKVWHSTRKSFVQKKGTKKHFLYNPKEAVTLYPKAPEKTKTT